MERPSDWQVDDLAILAGRIFERLERAYLFPADPWRLPVLATVDDRGPDARTVVLRDVGVDATELIFFSDHRALKVAQIQRNPRVALVFYDPVNSVQLRVHGSAELLLKAHRKEDYWGRLTEIQRGNYRTLRAPGEAIERPESGVESGPGDGWEQFAVFRVAAHQLDWLWLARSGHRRAQFKRSDARWSGYWVTP